jgi:hypothetical protein
VEKVAGALKEDDAETEEKERWWGGGEVSGMAASALCFCEAAARCLSLALQESRSFHWSLQMLLIHLLLVFFFFFF